MGYPLASSIEIPMATNNLSHDSAVHPMGYLAHGIPLDLIPWAYSCPPWENIKAKSCLYEVQPSLVLWCSPLLSAFSLCHLFTDPSPASRPPPPLRYHLSLVLFHRWSGPPPLHNVVVNNPCGDEQCSTPLGVLN